MDYRHFLTLLEPTVHLTFASKEKQATDPVGEEKYE
jgi:hypothetical protein